MQKIEVINAISWPLLRWWESHKILFSSLILSILGKMNGCLKRFEKHSMTKILKTEKLKSRLVHSEIFERWLMMHRELDM